MKYLAWASIVLALAGCGSSGAAEAFGTPGGTGAGSTGETGSTGAGGAGGGLTLPPLRATEVAVGATHSCALLADKTVACWGDGSHGQLGDGSSGTGYHRATAARVEGVTGAIALRAGDSTTCAVVAGGVVCWGDGTYGQLGDDIAYDGYFQATPVAVHGLEGVTDLSVRGSAACAALPDGTVRCWGLNGAEGELGFMSPDCGPYAMQVNGDTSQVAEPCEKTPRGVPGIMNAGAVVTSGQHSCDIDQGGVVSCWGADDFGQCGDGMSGPATISSSYTPVVGIGKAVQLALGLSHTCAVVGDQRTLACWGDDSLGQLGVGVPGLDAYQTKPIVVPGLAQVADLDAAGNVTCAALSDGRVQCWGDASRLFTPGVPTMQTPLKPKVVPGVTGVAEVRTSGDHACALREDASVICWGRNDFGQVGNGTMSLADDTLSPVQPPQTP